MMLKKALKKEINGPGKLLGYRAMSQNLRTEDSIHTSRHLVRNVMYDTNRDSIAARRVNKKFKKINNCLRQRIHCELYVLIIMINFVVIKIQPFILVVMAAWIPIVLKYFSLSSALQTLSQRLLERTI